jgi:hypothetical protein
MKETIEVKRAWLERILELAEEAGKEKCSMKVNLLIGYISSIKTILKYEDLTL